MSKLDAGGVLVITRPRGHYHDAIRSYRIVVDGQVRGKVRAGGELRLELSAGEHEVQARIDWQGSEVRSVLVSEGGTTRWRVEPSGGLFEVFGRTTWIKLTEVV